jgi:hypothetical protein
MRQAYLLRLKRKRIEAILIKLGHFPKKLQTRERGIKLHTSTAHRTTIPGVFLAHPGRLCARDVDLGDPSRPL